MLQLLKRHLPQDRTCYLMKQEWLSYVGQAGVVDATTTISGDMW
jgi:hypothetical protein